MVTYSGMRNSGIQTGHVTRGSQPIRKPENVTKPWYLVLLKIIIPSREMTMFAKHVIEPFGHSLPSPGP